MLGMLWVIEDKLKDAAKDIFLPPSSFLRIATLLGATFKKILNGLCLPADPSLPFVVVVAYLRMRLKIVNAFINSSRSS